MSTRAALAAEQERALYAYVFDACVDDRFRAYDETSRRERFRSIYARVLNERFARLYPLFCRMRGSLSVAELVDLRIELRDGARLPEDLDYYREIAERLIVGAPKAEMLADLLRVERAKRLAAHGPSTSLAQLLDEAALLDAPTLARADASGGSWDGEALHYVQLRTSLKESLATLRRAVGLPNWTVRTPSPRASVIYLSPSTGRVEHWCFTDRDTLSADLRRRCAG
ncbi:hypothetical protein G6O69_20150 [Pseudenhygromyxa sp. WMMC2535]|uniref:hypothetical protein n=1 Tax=Pseudenhygromyxa sp. WMMC2535 TaxID=2712867 RepID=UPI0015565E27|nr:hypothetical protein [Pseudenhygromyxa sp. WMMC2535]NVB40170.1 hypothetical protein [Pseudenhygromyxa sp. WMMC2535]